MSQTHPLHGLSTEMLSRLVDFALCPAGDFSPTIATTYLDAEGNVLVNVYDAGGDSAYDALDAAAWADLSHAHGKAHPTYTGAEGALVCELVDPILTGETENAETYHL